jgi:hypothetical protein
MATCSNNNNNNNISLMTSETNLLGADNNQAGKVLTGEEEEADNHEINIDRAIKGSCESSRVEPSFCIRLHSADLVSKGFS